MGLGRSRSHHDRNDLMCSIEQHIEFLIGTEEQELCDQILTVRNSSGRDVLGTQRLIENFYVLDDRSRSADLRLIDEPVLQPSDLSQPLGPLEGTRLIRPQHHIELIRTPEEPIDFFVRLSNFRVSPEIFDDGHVHFDPGRRPERESGRDQGHGQDRIGVAHVKVGEGREATIEPARLGHHCHCIRRFPAGKQQGHQRQCSKQRRRRADRRENPKAANHVESVGQQRKKTGNGRQCRKCHGKGDPRERTLGSIITLTCLETRHDMRRVGESERENERRDQGRDDVQIVSDPTHHADRPDQPERNGRNRHHPYANAAKEDTRQNTHQHEDDGDHQGQLLRQQPTDLGLDMRRSCQPHRHCGGGRSRDGEHFEIEGFRQKNVFRHSLEGDENPGRCAVTRHERPSAQWIAERILAQPIRCQLGSRRRFEKVRNFEIALDRTKPYSVGQPFDVMYAFGALDRSRHTNECRESLWRKERFGTQRQHDHVIATKSLEQFFVEESSRVIGRQHFIQRWVDPNARQPSNRIVDAGHGNQSQNDETQRDPGSMAKNPAGEQFG